MTNDLSEWFVNNSKPIVPGTKFRKKEVISMAKDQNEEFLKRVECELNDRLEKNGFITNLDLEECLHIDVGPWFYARPLSYEVEQIEYKPDKCPCCGQPWPKDS